MLPNVLWNFGEILQEKIVNFLYTWKKKKKKIVYLELLSNINLIEKFLLWKTKIQSICLTEMGKTKSLTKRDKIENST